MPNTRLGRSMGNNTQVSKFATIVNKEEEMITSDGTEGTKGVSDCSHSKEKGQLVIYEMDERGTRYREVRNADRGRTKLSQKAVYVVRGKENVEPMIKLGSYVGGPSNSNKMGGHLKPKNSTPKKNKALKSQRIHWVVSGSMEKSKPMKINEEREKNNLAASVLAENRNILIKKEETVTMRKKSKGGQKGTFELQTNLEELPGENNAEGLENGQNTHTGRASSKKNKSAVPPDK